MDNDVVNLITKHKIPVFVVEVDLAARGIDPSELVSEVEVRSSKMLPRNCPALVAMRIVFV